MALLAINGGEPIRTRPLREWPQYDQRDYEGLREVLESRDWGGYSPKVREFEERFAAYCGARFGISTPTGTSAIQLALRVLGVGPGDEVIVPAYTFIATASAVLLENAVPVFADVDSETSCLDVDSAKSLITERTKVILPVHLYGQPADMDRLLPLAREHGLSLLEDCAQAHGAEWRGQRVGSLGDMSAFSLMTGKNLAAGEAGIVLTDDEALAERARRLENQGRDLKRDFNAYLELGYNLRMSAFAAALLLPGMERLPAQLETRSRNAQFLAEGLRPFGLRHIRGDDRTTKHGYHIFELEYEEEAVGVSRETYLAAMIAEGIPMSTGYGYGLYRSPVFWDRKVRPKGCPLSCPFYSGQVDYTRDPERCPVTERLCHSRIVIRGRVLLEDQEELEDIIRGAEKVYENRAELQGVSALSKAGAKP